MSEGSSKRGSADRQVCPEVRSESTKARAKPLAAPPQSPVRKRSTRGRGSQAARQVRILRALEAARFGLSLRQIRDIVGDGPADRTLYRDLAQLGAIYAISSVDGRWSLDSTDRALRGVSLRPADVLALLVSEDLLSPAGTGWFAEQVGDLRRRLAAGLTPSGRAYVDELRTYCRATVFSPALADESIGALAVLQDAIEREHAVRITYQKPNDSGVDRVVEPWLLWHVGNAVYLAAYCRQAQDLRTFAVHRMTACHVLDEPFDRDPTFSAEQFVRQGFRVHHGPVHQVVIDFSPEVAHVAHERELHPSQQLEDLADGGARVRFEAGGLPEIAAWIAGFGGKAVALEPQELGEKVRELHERGLKGNRGEP